jgi:hypothetical protein
VLCGLGERPINSYSGKFWEIREIIVFLAENAKHAKNTKKKRDIPAA